MMSNGKNAEVHGWNFGEASGKGDSYLSQVNKIKIRGTVDGTEKEVSIVVKSLPKNIGRRKTYRSAEFFHNEIMFYTKVVPKFEEFLNGKQQRQVLSIPRHLVSVVDGENDFIALEDVSVLGFGPVSRQSCIDFKQCAVILKTMAKFHAISFAHKDQKSEEFAEIVSTLHETYFGKQHYDWYINFHKVLIGVSTDALAKEYPGSLAEKKYTSIPFGNLFWKCVDACSRQKAPTSVVTQGDAWAPNFLAKIKNGEDALMLDFQLARCSSPILDLSFCIYSCTDKKLRDESFDDLLKIYHNELANTITLLGSDPQKLYSWDTFMKEVKEYFMFGMVFSMEAIPFCLLDESQAFDLDTIIKGDEAADISKVWSLPNIATKSGRQRLASVIVHCAENDFI